MGVSCDTYDEKTPIHPRNKQLTCTRLARAGLNVAYGMEEFPTNGPFPVLIDYNVVSEGIQITITYDQTFNWNPIEIEGFYTCKQSDPLTCNDKDGLWQKV